MHGASRIDGLGLTRGRQTRSVVVAGVPLLGLLFGRTAPRSSFPGPSGKLEMRRVRRLPGPRTWLAAAFAASLLGATGCGSSSSPSSPTAPSVSAPPQELVQLDVGNFDALVLASPTPVLVEFHSPT